MVDSLFGDINNISTVNSTTKKRKTNKKVVKQVEDDIDLSDLIGDSTFKVNKKKANTKSETETDPEKLLKSKKLSLLERLAIINENVLRILGKQKKNILVIKTKEQLHDYISDCIKTGRIDIDTETNNSLDPVTCKLMGLCLYAPGLKQAYIPVNHRNPETKERLAWQLTEQDIKEELQRLVDAKTMIIMHNGKFDYEVICCTCDIRIKPDWDTMIAARLLNENEHASLKELYIKYIDPSQAKYKIDKLFEGVQYADVDPDIFALYAATDAMMTDRIYEIQVPKMEEADKEAKKRLSVDQTAPKGLYWVFKNIEMPIVIVTAEMEMRGVAVDTDFGAKLKTKYDTELAELDKTIEAELANLKDTILDWKLSPEANEKVKIYPAKKTKMSTEKIEKTFDRVDEEGKRFKYGKAKIELLEDPINLASPAQLAVLFYDILKCEAVNKDKVRGAGKDELEKLGEQLKKYSDEKQKALDMSDEELDEAFEVWSNNENLDEVDEEINETAEDLFVHKAAANLCNLILDRRKIVKLISTYIDVIPELTKHWPDGRIRFHLNSMGTDTGRYSSGGKLKFMEGEEEVEVSGINIQNIPSHNKEIRLLFRAKPGYKIVGSDYSAQEPRLTAFLSKDPLMYQAYIEGKDLYAMIAQSAFDNEYWENLEFYPEGTEIELDGKKIICGNKTHLNKAGKERRSVGKVLLLASTYGMSGATAGARMGKTKEEGQALLDKFFNKYTKVRKAIDYSQSLLKEKGYVEDWAGRRRNLKDIMELPNYEVKFKNEDATANFNPILGCGNRKVKDPLIIKWEAEVNKAIEASQVWQAKQAAKAGKTWTRNGEMSNKKLESLAKEALADGVVIQSWTGKKAKAMRQCFNARIQGGAASLTKLAMIKINNDELMNKWDAHLIITVHDEVLVECPEQYAELVEERLPKLMVDAAKENGIDIPMRCDPYNVNHWYIDEFTVAIQDEFKKLEAKGLARDEAMNKVIKNHSELSPESIRNTIETGAEIVL